MEMIRMAKIYIDTDNMSKENLVQLHLDKDKKIEELEHFKFLVLKIYEETKVGDTCRIQSDNKEHYIEKMEDLMLIENKKLM